MALHLILGGMRAGKTNRLITDYIKFKQEKKTVCIINWTGDIERTKTPYLKSHDNIMVECLNVESFNDPSILEVFKENKTDVFLLNEGQFFPDLKKTYLYIVEELKKDLYIYALDGDFNRENFGEIHQLIPHCDTYEKLYARCDCGKKALFSKRLVQNSQQTLIGSNIYKSVCRECYNL